MDLNQIIDSFALTNNVPNIVSLQKYSHPLNLTTVCYITVTSWTILGRFYLTKTKLWENNKWFSSFFLTKKLLYINFYPLLLWWSDVSSKHDATATEFQLYCVCKMCFCHAYTLVFHTGQNISDHTTLFVMFMVQLLYGYHWLLYYFSD